MSIRIGRRHAFLCGCGTVVLCMCQVGGLGAAVDPNNAALVYYQALLARPEPNDYEEINNVLNGANPSDNLKEYLSQRGCRDAIALAEAAAQIPRCDWGLLPSEPRGLIGETLPELRRFGILLAVEARTLASQGQWQAALEMCTTLRRFTSHIGDDTYLMYSIANTLDTRALACVRDVLRSMPPDGQMLTWLRDQLRATEGAQWRPSRALGRWRDMEEQFWRMWPGEGTFSRSDFLKEPRIEKIEDEAVRKKIVDMTDEQKIVLLLLEARMSKDRSAISVPPRVLAQARRACDGFLGSALQIIGSNAPYKETYDKLEQMVASLEDRTRDGDPIALLSDATRSVATYYRIHIGNTASLNATRAAVEIYLIWANTGHLPETLPEGLPRDPYSGRAFQYKKTEDGFVLGVDPDHVAYLREREFAFEVQRP